MWRDLCSPAQKRKHFLPPPESESILSGGNLKRGENGREYAFAFLEREKYFVFWFQKSESIPFGKNQKTFFPALSLSLWEKDRAGKIVLWRERKEREKKEKKGGEMLSLFWKQRDALLFWNQKTKVSTPPPERKEWVKLEVEKNYSVVCIAHRL